MSCIVYIDESGDAGIRKVRSNGSKGASPFFVISAAVIPKSHLESSKNCLIEVEKCIGRQWKHATDLNHSQKVYFCRQAASLNLRMFSVISNKDTLGDYRQNIDEDPHKFYNKCTVYLLECVGQYLKGKGLFESEPDVVFENRNHNFDALRRYVSKIKDNPIHERAKLVQCFNPFGFVERAKNEEPLLKFADLVAHATYSCVNKSKANYSITETRYIREMQKRFGADSKGKVLGNGLKCIHSLEKLHLDADVEAELKMLKAEPRVQKL